jgi:tetratricopeptide (TPR) repeat protein
MPLIFLSLVAATAAALPAEVKSTTPQEDFDAASTAAAAHDCAKAIPMFEALESSPNVKPGSLTASVISLRKGICLIEQGRAAESESAILAGLPVVEKAGKDFAIDAGQALLTLGDTALVKLDYDRAKDYYGKARQVPLLEQLALAGLIKATTFEPGPEPLAYADEGIRLASAQPKPSKETLAAFHTLKARVLLSRGQTETAYAVLKNALDLSGGLTLRTTLSESAMRGDLALAAMLLNRKDDARKYLAYTGAGRITASPFATAVSMAPPDCGEETGLRPEDFAVVEFGISGDGSINSAQTVYTRGGPAVAVAFAKAVREWYWRAEDLAKIPAFYRIATRVELRCSTAGEPSPSLLKPLSDRFGEWAAQHLKSAGPSPGTRADLIAVLRHELAGREAEKDIAGQVAASGLLAIADPRVSTEILAMLDRAIAISTSAHVPAHARNTLRVLRLWNSPYVKSVKSRTVRGDLAALLQDPALTQDALAIDTLRLLEDTATGASVTQQVADDDRLALHHPLRQLALLKLANRAASSGDLAGAQAFFGRTGLTEQQCAFIGAKPSLRRTGADSNDFPMEAMQYGFEGWVNLEFDITADGKTINARPVIAYPPFVFVDAAKGMTRDIRYEASYRPSGSVACNAHRETIRFILP